MEEQFYLFWPAAVNTLSRKWLSACALAVFVASPFVRGVMFALGHTAEGGYTWLVADGLASGALLAILIRTFFRHAPRGSRFVKEFQSQRADGFRGCGIADGDVDLPLKALPQQRTCNRLQIRRGLGGADLHGSPTNDPVPRVGELQIREHTELLVSSAILRARASAATYSQSTGSAPCARTLPIGMKMRSLYWR